MKKINQINDEAIKKIKSNKLIEAMLLLRQGEKILEVLFCSFYKFFSLLQVVAEILIDF